MEQGGELDKEEKKVNSRYLLECLLNGKTERLSGV